MANLTTFYINGTSKTAREAEVTGADWDTGLNYSGSNAPGIGVCTNVVNPKLDDWTILDQAEAARAPQDSEHIGTNGLGAGGGDPTPLKAIQGDQSGDGDLVGVDGNDTLSFIEALAQAAPGVGFGALNADPINRSSVTIEIGDRAWGTNTVA